MTQAARWGQIREIPANGDKTVILDRVNSIA